MQTWDVESREDRAPEPARGPVRRHFFERLCSMARFRKGTAGGASPARSVSKAWSEGEDWAREQVLTESRQRAVGHL